MYASLDEIPHSLYGFNLIERILQALERAGVIYCVLRNSSEICEKFPSGDVDILVDNSLTTFYRIKKIIYELQNDFGFIVYASGNHANVSRNVYLATKVAGEIHTVNLEFFNQVFVYEYRALKNIKYAYLDSKKILKNRIRKNIFFSSSVEYEFVHKVVDSLFNDKKTYFPWLDGTYDSLSKQKHFQEVALETLGKNATKKLRDISWVSQDQFMLNELKQEIFQHLKAYKRLPLALAFKRDLFSIFQHVKQYFYYNGLFCLVLGTDGSGKTSICDTVSSRRQRSYNKIHRIHLGNRPILLGSLRGEKINNPSNQINEKLHNNFHEYDLGPKKISLYQSLRLIYISVDFMLHYWCVIRPLLARGDMFLTERYFTDYVVVPERYFPSTPRWLKRLCFRFIPKPDVTVYISTGREQILARKIELPSVLLDHEIRQFEKYTVAEALPIISNSGDIGEAVDQLEAIIFTKGS